MLALVENVTFLPFAMVRATETNHRDHKATCQLTHSPQMNAWELISYLADSDLWR